MDRIGRKTRIKEPDAPNGARWLTTFNDMMTLLMVFFVMLFAMGRTDVNRFHNFQNALQSAIGILNPGKHAPVGIPSEDPNDPFAVPRSDPSATDGAGLSPLENTSGLEAEYTQRGIHLTLNDELMFNSGSAQLTEPGAALLDKVAGVIGPLKRRIRVEGHTDDLPIATDRYPSNWELSTARAVQVVKYLQTYGAIPAGRLSAAGYGASKPRTANDSNLGRMRNRRVEIILQPEVQSQSVQ